MTSVQGWLILVETLSEVNVLSSEFTEAASITGRSLLQPVPALLPDQLVNLACSLATTPTSEPLTATPRFPTWTSLHAISTPEPGTPLPNNPCGDGVCEGPENTISCPRDCEEVAVAPPERSDVNPWRPAGAANEME